MRWCHQLPRRSKKSNSSLLDPSSGNGDTFISVSSGSEHICGTTVAGVVECTGTDRDGQCNGEHPWSPSNPSDTFASVAAGGMHTCALTPSGVIECLAGTLPDHLDFGQTHGGLPWTAPNGDTFVAVSAGNMHTYGLTSSGIILCVGRTNNSARKPGKPTAGCRGRPPLRRGAHSRPSPLVTITRAG